MAEKRTKSDKAQRQADQLEKKARHPVLVRVGGLCTRHALPARLQQHRERHRHVAAEFSSDCALVHGLVYRWVL